MWLNTTCYLMDADYGAILRKERKFTVASSHQGLGRVSVGNRVSFWGSSWCGESILRIACPTKIRIFHFTYPFRQIKISFFPILLNQ